MRFRHGRYFWKLFLINAALMAFLLAASIWVILAQFDRFYETDLSRHLTAQATALKLAVASRFDDRHAPELASLANQMGSTPFEGVRVTFVLADGKVIGDSEANPETMESHANRPEIHQALVSGVGESTRWSHTVAKNLKYVAVRVGTAQNPRGVVRVAMAVQSIGVRAAPAQKLMIAVAAVAVVAVIVLAMALALLWSRRIARIAEAARNLSRGDLTSRVTISGQDEIAALGRALNRMRQRLARHVATIEHQRRTLDSLVTQLREGVAVADSNGRMVLINAEAKRMLEIAPPADNDSLVGLTVEQCIPQHRLQEMLLAAELDHEHRDRERKSESGYKAVHHQHPSDQEAHLTIPTVTGTRSVLARAFDIRFPPADGEATGSQSSSFGRMLILTDVTELTRVMQVKADLAANASHELRTPLSTMRAALDTLTSLNLVHDSQAASRVIKVLDRQNARMEAIIGDLLELSRLESGSSRFETASIRADAMLEELRLEFVDALAAKKLNWAVDLPSPVASFEASPELVRMVLRHLIDNAIRFNHTGGEVRVTFRPDDQAMTVEVADSGCGISPEEQPRVFERFYQVERARSGPDRGTGLGLSIVRYAAIAMQAEVTLVSEPGVGSRVSVKIPQCLSHQEES